MVCSRLQVIDFSISLTNIPAIHFGVLVGIGAGAIQSSSGVTRLIQLDWWYWNAF